jgi:hypothetical protein
MPGEIRRDLDNEEQENRKKLVALRAAIAHSMASGIAPESSRERIHRHILERAARERKGETDA